MLTGGFVPPVERRIIAVYPFAMMATDGSRNVPGYYGVAAVALTMSLPPNLASTLKNVVGIVFVTPSSFPHRRESRKNKGSLRPLHSRFHGNDGLENMSNFLPLRLQESSCLPKGLRSLGRPFRMPIRLVPAEQGLPNSTAEHPTATQFR